MNKAIRTLAVRKGRLHRVAVAWQRFGHNISQLNFAERPARLFVTQDVLQRQHITTQLRNVVLSFVDRLQSLLQLSQRLSRAP